MEVLEIVFWTCFIIFLLWIVTAGIGYDDPENPNEFDID